MGIIKVTHNGITKKEDTSSAEYKKENNKRDYRTYSEKELMSMSMKVLREVGACYNIKSSSRKNLVSLILDAQEGL